jgi:DNA-binding SARP family transcriptional activator
MTSNDKPEVILLLTATPQLQLAGGKTLELGRRDALLLALLATEGPQPRGRVASLMWPRSLPEAARNTLRQRLFALRKQCGHDLVVGSATLELADSVSHDLADAPTLLGQLQLPECPEFDQWLQSERQRRQCHQRESLAVQIDALEAAGDLGGALSLVQNLLQLDPLSEDAHRRLIRLFYLRGDRSSAMLAFDRCAEILKDEVGALPSAATMQLLDSIQRVQAPQTLGARRQVPPSVLRPPKMVGREALRQRALNDIDAGLVAVVVGEAGMGKSRLLAELGTEVDAHQGRFVSAAARPGDAGVPYASLARLLRELIRHCPSALAPAPRNELARFMPELGPVATGSVERQRLVLEQAVSTLIEASSAEVSVLAFDDLHFADEASLDMLQALVATESSLQMRWVLALRPAEADSHAAALLDALAEAGRLANAVLTPLSMPELEELVDSLGVPELVGSQLAASLHQQSGGNPLFALETIKRLLIEEAIAHPQGGPVVLSTLPRPASVLALIERRLGHLSAAALAVARVAAVASADFSIDVAQHVLEQPALLLSDAWSELERAQVLRDSAFAHDLVFEAVLQGIPKPIARHTHDRVAQYLAQHHGEAASIAAHHLAADQSRESLPWLKQAAKVAGQALRTKEQMDFLLKAAEIEELAGLKGDAFESLKEAVEIEGQGGISPNWSLGKRLESLAQSDRQIAMALSIRMHQFGNSCQYEEATDLGHRALKHADVELDAELYHHIRQYWGTVLAFSGKNEEALAAMEPIAAWVDANATLDVQGEYHGNLGVVLDNLGKLDEAVPHHLRAREASRSLGLWAQAATELGNLALNRLDAGDIHSALGYLRESEQLNSQYEHQEAGAASPALTLSVCTRVLGQFKEALNWADQAQQRGLGVPTISATAGLRLVEIWVDLGQHARASKLLDEVLETPDLSFGPQVTSHCVRAQAQRMQGQAFGASLERALALLPDGNRPDLRHRILLMRALQEPPLQALALTERVVEEARSIGHQGTVMAAWARRAGCLWQHDPALALEAAQRALEMAQTLDSLNLYRPELWLNASRAMRACGLEDQAKQQLVMAREWIMNCVSSGQVPEPFVDSFLHRNPINREALSLV